jgi:hypothetical protein
VLNNSFNDLRRYFGGSAGTPIPLQEMFDFWASLSSKDKEELKWLKLPAWCYLKPGQTPQ